MKAMQLLTAAGLGLALTGCGAGRPDATMTRSAMIASPGTEARMDADRSEPGASSASGGMARSTSGTALDLRVTGIDVVVPTALRVSEAGGFYPTFTDIVWRGDPIGDRRAQIVDIFEEAAARASATDAGSREVTAMVVLERFHGVTERTRYTVGGVYNIRFTMTYVDASTGAPLGSPELVVANLSAPGGQAAVELERQGQTERVRVTDHLAYVLGQEFATPVRTGP